MLVNDKGMMQMHETAIESGVTWRTMTPPLYCAAKVTKASSSVIIYKGLLRGKYYPTAHRISFK